MTINESDIFENKYCSLSEIQSESVFHLNVPDFRKISKKPRQHLDSEYNPLPEKEIIEIQLASQFYTLLGSVNDAANNTECCPTESDFLKHLSHQENYCTSIISRTNDILFKLNALKEKYHSVSQKTSSLHETCEKRLQKQTKLSEKILEVENHLQFFNNLANVEVKLAAQNVHLYTDRMQPIFELIDSSVLFLEKHMDYKDASVFLIRFKKCLNTALNMVKESVKNTIKRIVLELLDLGDAISPDNSFLLLYGRFRSQGARIRSLMSLIENRPANCIDYENAATECQLFYLEKRESFVKPVAMASISDLTSKYTSDHCELFRTTVSFILHMCEDEIALYNRFFIPNSSKALSSMLGSLCQCAYNSLRPFLVHLNHIEILTELCDLLRCEFLEEQSINNRSDLSAFLDMCASLLADVQQRLIYRSHVYIKSQILDYSPCPGDLAYPEKLDMMKGIETSLQMASSMHNKSNGNGPVATEIPPSEIKQGVSTDFHGLWYPTVRRALVCISNLSRCLEVESFQGLAQNCVSNCIQSLVKAKNMIEPLKSSMDAQLFYIKHLLILREQMTPFDVDFRVKETNLDFSNLKAAAYSALPKIGSHFFDLHRANTLLRLLLEGPMVVEVDLDSRQMLDRALKSTCEEFINRAQQLLTGEIPSLLSKAKNSPTKKVDVIGTPDQLREAVTKSVRYLAMTNSKSSHQPSVCLSSIRQKLLLYLNNPNTVAIIMRPVETGVSNCWRQFSLLLAENYSNEDRMIIGCPTDSQIRLFFHV